MRAASSAAAQALEDVTFYYFRTGRRAAEDREFTHRIDAKRAELTSGFWQLQRRCREPRRTAEMTRARDRLGRADQPAQTTRCCSASLRPRPFRSGTSPASSRDGRDAGMDVDAYVLKFHTLLATPVFMLAMALIGAVVCLRLARSGGLSQLIGAGALAGFVLFFVTRLAAGMSAVGRHAAGGRRVVPAPVRAVRCPDPARPRRGRLNSLAAPKFRGVSAGFPAVMRCGAGAACGGSSAGTEGKTVASLDAPHAFAYRFEGWESLAISARGET